MPPQSFSLHLLLSSPSLCLNNSGLLPVLDQVSLTCLQKRADLWVAISLLTTTKSSGTGGGEHLGYIVHVAYPALTFKSQRDRGKQSERNKERVSTASKVWPTYYMMDSQSQGWFIGWVYLLCERPFHYTEERISANECAVCVWEVLLTCAPLTHLHRWGPGMDESGYSKTT